MRKDNEEKGTEKCNMGEDGRGVRWGEKKEGGRHSEISIWSMNVTYAHIVVKWREQTQL